MHQLMKSRHWLMAVILTVASLTQVQAAEPTLLDSVTEELGITQEQASAALGSLFKLANKEMKGTDFEQLAEIVPDMDSLLKTAPKMKESSTSKMLGGLSGLGGSFGKASQSSSNLVMLNSALAKLGIDSSQAAPLLETVYNYVQSEGGQALLEKMKKALGL